MNTPARAVSSLMGPLYFDAEAMRFGPSIARAKDGHITPPPGGCDWSKTGLIGTLRALGRNIIDLGSNLLPDRAGGLPGIHFEQTARSTKSTHLSNRFRFVVPLWRRIEYREHCVSQFFPSPHSVGKTPCRSGAAGEQYRAFRVQGTFRYTTTHRNLIDSNEDFMIPVPPCPRPQPAGVCDRQSEHGLEQGPQRLGPNPAGGSGVGGGFGLGSGTRPCIGNP